MLFNIVLRFFFIFFKVNINFCSGFKIVFGKGVSNLTGCWQLLSSKTNGYRWYVWLGLWGFQRAKSLELHQDLHHHIVTRGKDARRPHI